MNYLLDTNHWSYLQRRETSVVSHIQSLSDAATLYMPVVAQAELLAGVELAVHEPRKQELQTLYAQIITMAADILPIISQVAEQFAHIFVMLRRKGRPIDTNDIWIAAAASYSQSLALADALGMRPLQAHCHFGLGTLHVKTGQREQARAALLTAIELYRAMDMAFWLPQTEAVLAQVE